MKTFTILLINLLIGLSVFAQPKAEAVEIPADKKYKYYSKRMKRTAKPDKATGEANDIHSVAYGIAALQKTKKKRSTKKVVEFVAPKMEALADYLNSQMTTWKVKMEETQDPAEQVNYQLRIVSALLDYEKAVAAYNALPANKRSMLPEISLPESETAFRAMLQTETDKLAEKNNIAAETYYQQAAEQKDATHWKEHRTRYELLSKVQYYNPQYDNIDAEVSEARKQATCDVLLAYNNRSSRKITTASTGELSNARLRKSVQSRLGRNRKFKKDGLVNMVNGSNADNADVKIVFTIQNVSITKDRDKKPVTEQHSKTSKTTVGKKETDKTAATKTITATSNTYSKRSTITYSGYYTIIDTATGEQIGGDDFEATSKWSATWVTVSGDKKALPAKVKKLPAKEPAYPSVDEMMDTKGKGVDALTERITAIITPYALKWQ